MDSVLVRFEVSVLEKECPAWVSATSHDGSVQVVPVLVRMENYLRSLCLSSRDVLVFSIVVISGVY